jgi:hypothetical protein
MLDDMTQNATQDWISILKAIMANSLHAHRLLHLAKSIIWQMT